MILAGDVGGTKTHLALFEPGEHPRRPALERKFPSGEHASLESLVLEFLDAASERPTRAVLGIAGPVVNNRTEATNLPWVIDGSSMSAALGEASVTLINDLEATAWGLPLLEASELEVLQPGSPAAGNRALIAAGTGLGEAFLVWNGQSHLPSASEGGHTDFGPRDPLEDELNQWLRGKYARTSYERVLSGPGLADFYRFMSASGRAAEPAQFAERFAAAPDPAAVVTQAALDGSCERARATLEHWVSIYGAEAGNLALKALAVGGVYVGGGIAPRIVPALRAGGFIDSFRRKGRLTPLLERIPVRVILDSRTALWGAAAVALAGDASPTHSVAR
jgi:glucokinase